MAFTKIEEEKVMMSISEYNKLIDAVTKTATKVTYDLIDSRKKKEKLEEKLTTSEVASEERVSSKTVLNWIKEGIKGGKIKLKATKKGLKDYQIKRKDLKFFLEQKQRGLYKI